MRAACALAVGVVGLNEHAGAIEALRAELPPHVYLWVNAYKRQTDYYSPEMLEFLTTVDLPFPLNTRYHLSAGRVCWASARSVIPVDGDGTRWRRCHFVKTPIGNIYDLNFAHALRARAVQQRHPAAAISAISIWMSESLPRVRPGHSRAYPQEPIWPEQQRPAIATERHHLSP